MRILSIGYVLYAPLRVRLLQLLALLAICTVSLPAVSGPIEDLQPGHWYDVPNSQLKSLDPCPASTCSWSANEGVAAVMNDWGGGAFATGFGTKGGLVVTAGGHNGYYGNELYVFDVGTLKWQRVTNPLDNPSCDYTEGELQDQSPCASHTYDFLQYHPGTNSFVQLGSTSNQSEGGGGSAVTQSVIVNVGSLTAPPAPPLEQARVYVVVAASALIASVPETALVPDQPPEAVQLSAFSTFQVSVTEALAAMLVELA